MVPNGQCGSLTYIKIQTDDDGTLEIIPEHIAQFAKRLPNLEHFCNELKIDSAADLILSNFKVELLRKSAFLRSLRIRFIPDQMEQATGSFGAK